MCRDELHYRNLQHFLPILDEIFIYIVLNWSSVAVRMRTERIIKALKLTIMYEKEIYKGMKYYTDGWEDGFYVVILQKLPFR